MSTFESKLHATLEDVARVMRARSALLDRIIMFEGRTLTNDPDDPGGLTKFGITFRSWDAADGIIGDDDPSVFAQMTEAQARAFYAANFILPYDFIADEPLQAAVVDYAVHSGPKTSVSALQSALGVRTDGDVGPETIEAVKGLTPSRTESVRRLHITLRLMDMGRQIEADPKKAKYASGWMKRVGHVLVEPVPGQGVA